MSGEEEEKAPVPAPSKATAAEADEELKLYRGLEVGGSVLVVLWVVVPCFVGCVLCVVVCDLVGVRPAGSA